jgi:hypothetical protein
MTYITQRWIGPHLTITFASMFIRSDQQTLVATFRIPPSARHLVGCRWWANWEITTFITKKVRERKRIWFFWSLFKILKRKFRSLQTILREKSKLDKKMKILHKSFSKTSRRKIIRQLKVFVNFFSNFFEKVNQNASKLL